MADLSPLLPFFVGVLVCAAIAWAGERSHRYFEARRRQYIARIRRTRALGLVLWPEEVPL